MSFLSGIVGRYLYIHILSVKSNVESMLENYEKGFQTYGELRNVSQDEIIFNMQAAFTAAGGVDSKTLSTMTLIPTLVQLFFGELRLAFMMPKTTWGGAVVRFD